MSAGRLFTLFLALGLVLAARSGWSQAAQPALDGTIGTVVNLEGEAWMKVDTERQVATDDVLVLNSEIRTGRRARLDAVLEPSDRFGGFAMLSKTVVQILSKGQHFDIIKIGDGTLLRQGPGEVQTPKLDKIIGHGTEFIVRFDAAAGLTEVIGVSGHVEVMPRGGRKPMSVDVKAKLSIGPRGIDYRPLRPEEFDRELRQFEFIGKGRAESQLVANRLAEGEGLKAKEQAPIVPDEWPKRADPPFIEPPDVVKAPRIGIEF